MKRYLMAGITIVTVVVFSAFINNHEEKQATYTWKETDAMGNVIPGGDFYSGTNRPDAVIHFGCDQGSQFCAKAFNSSNQPVPSLDLKEN